MMLCIKWNPIAGQNQPRSAKDTASIDEISKLLQSFENKIDQKIASLETPKPSSSVPKSTLVCFYCHREGHGTNCCYELQKDKEDKLVEQRGNNFFLPSGALIPFDSSRPIGHVVASYQPPPPVNVVSTPPVNAPAMEF